MTGLDCLKKELLDRGFTKQQTESKVVLGVLDVLSGSGGKYTDMDKIEKDLSELEKKVEETKKACTEYERKARYYRDEFNEIIKTIDKKCDENYDIAMKQISAFQKALDECETPEGKDALRAAQMFVNSVTVDTKYDNTAYIIGLASILSRGNVAPIDELKKINKKIPHLEIKPYWTTVDKNGNVKPYRIDDKDSHRRL